MPINFTIPLTTLQVGSQVFGPANVQNQDSTVTLSIDRTVAGGLNSLTANSELDMLAEVSTDNGATWHAVDTTQPGTQTSWGTVGGVYQNKNGTATTSSGTWPLAPGNARRIRATVTVAGPSAITIAGSIVTA